MTTTTVPEIRCRECAVVIPSRTKRGQPRQFCGLCRPSKPRKKPRPKVPRTGTTRPSGDCDYMPDGEAFGYEAWCRREGFDPVTRTYRRDTD